MADIANILTNFKCGTTKGFVFVNFINSYFPCSGNFGSPEKNIPPQIFLFIFSSKTFYFKLFLCLSKRIKKPIKHCFPGVGLLKLYDK